MKILITGANGLVGTALMSILKTKSEHVLLHPSSKECNFESYEETFHYFQSSEPDAVIHLAANVGGLYKNMNQKVDMFEKNLLINFNILKCAHLLNINNVVSCLSTCIFPDDITYPIDESMLHNGPPHFSNDSYAYAKRMLQIHSSAYNEQYNRNFKCIIPTNIYGPGDNFSLENGHVIPSLIHKCYLAKAENKDFVVRGTGKPLRQFIFSNDLANLIVWVLESYDEKEPIILSVDEKDEISIREVAIEIAKNYDYEHKIVFDSSFSDGQYKKTASNTKLRKYLPNYKFITIQEGVKKSVDWFSKNYETCRR